MNKSETLELRRISITSRAYGFILIFLLCSNLLFGTGHASQAAQAFRDADQELNEVYKVMLAKIKDPKERNLFIAAQNAWIKYRDAEVALDAYVWPVGKGGLFRKTKITEERVAYFQSVLESDKDNGVKSDGKK